MTEMRSEIREFREQNTRLHNAAREDLTDFRSQMNDGFAEMRGKFDATAAGLQQVTDMLNTLMTQEGDQHRDQ